jgi:hypothetical protein
LKISINKEYEIAKRASRLKYPFFIAVVNTSVETWWFGHEASSVLDINHCAHNFYLGSIVHTILPSFALLPTAPGHKKQKNKNKNKLFHVQIKKNPDGLSNIPPYT